MIASNRLKQLTLGSLVWALAGCAALPASDAPAKTATSRPGSAAAGSPISTSAINAAPSAQGVDYSAADQRFQSALQLLKDKQYGKAKDAFADLVKDYPSLSGPLTDLGILQVQSKQKDAAFQSFAKAVAADPQNAVAFNGLGTLYREHGDLPHAEQAYKKALALRPDYRLAHYNLGVLYDVYLHRPKDAIAEYSAYLAGSGSEDLKVQAWIKALQAQTGAPKAAG